jgi:endonuclease/exonuclease/phosphatase family metal-dependent hydrolase
MKKLVLLLAVIIGSIIAIFVLLLAYLSVREYRPRDIETVTIQTGKSWALSTNVPLSILAWNIGYAALDASEDFFMDGGTMVRPSSATKIRENLEGIKRIITNLNADIVLLQEVDLDSHRSYNNDEVAFLSAGDGYSSAFVYNFFCPFVPFPVPPIGKVASGLLTLNSYNTSEVVRMSLPVPFRWPVRIANLKRCLLIERVPVGDHELVLVNLHLEAYESGAGREAQTKILVDFLMGEYAKGNYCIAGGDFNQTFPDVSTEQYPVINTEYFVPGTLSSALLPEDWHIVTDTSTPSSRLNNKPYSGDLASTQFYVIDGFILSPNVELLSINTENLDFQYSDHNPIRVKVVLQ